MKNNLLLGLIVVILVVSTLNFASPQPLIRKVDALDWPGDPAIQLVKSANVTTIHSGDPLQYKLNVTNVGNTTLHNVNVVDDTFDFVLDPVIGPITLAPGEFSVKLVNVSLGGLGTVTNIATANGTSPEGYTVTDNATVTVLVVDQSIIFPSIESCDSTGVREDTFNVGNDVYVNGTGFGDFNSYSLYVVEDQAVWTDNMTIPTRIPGTATTVYSDAAGNIPPTLAWSNPLVPGKYDIVVDVNGNGRYDVNIDALDNKDIMVTAGIFVVPEVTIGSVMAIASMFTALGLYAYKKKSTQ